MKEKAIFKYILFQHYLTVSQKMMLSYDSETELVLLCKAVNK